MLARGQLAPLRLAPRLVRRMWGGGRLPALHGQPEPDDGGEDPVGESWLAGDDSVVSEGPLSGATLAELTESHGEALVGEATVRRYGRRMALLVKLLDAADDLSVQVHPDDAYAARFEAATGHLGKAEAWYVLEAGEGAAVLRGFERPVTHEEAAAAVADGTLPGLLERLPVTRGDVVVNPAGTVHAVGAGLLLYEVQQSSDLTYRLYDYGRRDAGGRLRELHVEKALAVADLSGSSYRPPEGGPNAAAGREQSGWRRLVVVPQFVLEAAVLDGAQAARRGEVRGATDGSACHILTVVDGEVALGCRGQTLLMEKGATVLVPAAPSDYELSGGGEVLRARAA